MLRPDYLFSCKEKTPLLAARGSRVLGQLLWRQHPVTAQRVGQWGQGCPSSQSPGGRGLVCLSWQWQGGFTDLWSKSLHLVWSSDKGLLRWGVLTVKPAGLRTPVPHTSGLLSPRRLFAVSFLSSICSMSTLPGAAEASRVPALVSLTEVRCAQLGSHPCLFFPSRTSLPCLARTQPWVHIFRWTLNQKEKQFNSRLLR